MLEADSCCLEAEQSLQPATNIKVRASVWKLELFSRQESFLVCMLSAALTRFMFRGGNSSSYAEENQSKKAAAPQGQTCALTFLQRTLLLCSAGRSPEGTMQSPWDCAAARGAVCGLWAAVTR